MRFHHFCHHCARTVLLPALASIVMLPAAQAGAMPLDTTVLRLLMFVDWPEKARQGREFILCQPAGQRPLAAPPGHQIHGMTLHMKQMGSENEGAECHALFIDSGDAAVLRRIKARTLNMPVLILAKNLEGAGISLFEAADGYRFEINLAALQRRQLHVQPQLLALSRRIRHTH